MNQKKRVIVSILIVLSVMLNYITVLARARTSTVPAAPVGITVTNVTASEIDIS